MALQPLPGLAPLGAGMCSLAIHVQLEMSEVQSTCKSHWRLVLAVEPLRPERDPRDHLHSFSNSLVVHDKFYVGIIVGDGCSKAALIAAFMTRALPASAAAYTTECFTQNISYKRHPRPVPENLPFQLRHLG